MINCIFGLFTHKTCVISSWEKKFLYSVLLKNDWSKHEDHGFRHIFIWGNEGIGERPRNPKNVQNSNKL